MALNFLVVNARAMAYFGAVPDTVRAALKTTAQALAGNLQADARRRAQAHIRHLGRKAPGSYVESIHAGVAQTGDRLSLYLRSSHPLAHLMEYGANRPVHEIVPSAATVLAFEGRDAATVFRKTVHQGSVMPPYPAIVPAFDAAKPAIREAFEEAVREAARH